MATPPFRLGQVLCPTDFSDFSKRALRHAIAIARVFEAELTVAYVSPYPVPLGGEVPYDASMLLGSVARAELVGKLRAFMDPALAAGIRVRGMLREGDPSRQIARIAEELRADLVVLGTHGRSGFERLILGSVTDELLVQAACPVLTVCHSDGPVLGTSGPFPRILCATDLGPTASATLTYALSLAEQFRAELTVLHVLEGTLASDARRQALVGGLRWSHAEEARGRLRNAIPPEAGERIAVRELVAAGRAPEQILRIACDEDARLIVLGAHAYGALGRLLFGSTSHHVVREAPCPVLSVCSATSRGQQRVMARQAVSA
jgi:nucleotide-binding universal stress UspA family protein